MHKMLYRKIGHFTKWKDTLNFQLEHEIKFVQIYADQKMTL